MSLDPRIRIVVAGNFVAVAGRMGLVTFLGIYFVREVGIGVAMVGAAFLVENLTRGIVAPFAGALSDRIGRRIPILFGLLGNAAILPCFLLVQSPAALLVWSVAMGVVGATQFPIGNALLADLAPEGRRQFVFAINYTAISVGYTIGVAPAGFLAQTSYALLAAAAAGCYLAVAALFAVALRGPLPREPGRTEASVVVRMTEVMRDRVFLGFAAIALVFPFSMGLFAFVLALFGADRGVPEGTIGLVLAANGVLTALFAIPVAARIEPLGPFRLLGPAAICVAVSFIFNAALSNPVWGLAAAVLVFTAAELVFSSAVPACITRLAAPGLRGAYQGVWSFVQSFGMGSAFMASGLIRDFAGWTVAWLLFAGYAALAGAALIAVRERLLQERGARSASPPTGSGLSA